MKIRQAKKILFSSKSWKNYCRKLRPSYYDEERKVWVQPSWHDIPNRTYQRARRKYFGAARKFKARYGYTFDTKHKNYE